MKPLLKLTRYFGVEERRATGTVVSFVERENDPFWLYISNPSKRNAVPVEGFFQF